MLRLVPPLVLCLLCACGPGAEEGACFAPEEVCGGTLCSQAAYCDAARVCRSKLLEGVSCSEPKQCASGTCEAGRCAGAAQPCVGIAP